MPEAAGEIAETCGFGWRPLGILIWPAAPERDIENERVLSQFFDQLSRTLEKQGRTFAPTVFLNSFLEGLFQASLWPTNACYPKDTLLIQRCDRIASAR